MNQERRYILCNVRIELLTFLVDSVFLESGLTSLAGFEVTVASSPFNASDVACLTYE